MDDTYSPEMFEDLKRVFELWIHKYPLNQMAGTLIGAGLAFAEEAGIPKAVIVEHVNKVYP